MESDLKLHKPMLTDKHIIISHLSNRCLIAGAQNGMYFFIGTCLTNLSRFYTIKSSNFTVPVP